MNLLYGRSNRDMLASSFALIQYALFIPHLIFTNPLFATAQSNQNSKRGLAYHTPTDPNDFALFFSDNSTISWYYNWSPYPSRIPSSSVHPIEFLPMVHGTSNLQSDLDTIKRLARSNDQSFPNRRRHVLAFNEPDGSTDSGGSDISPRDAARAYLDWIVPLRSSPYNLLISHPVVTGSGNGLDWLRSFNASCHELNPDEGCAADFIAAHFYGGFEAMAGWLGTLHALYESDPHSPENMPIYLTEYALPQSSAEQAGIVLNQSLTFLDETLWIGGYAWFGMFRTSEANEWTGAGNAMLDSNGGLTQIGATYLGGATDGFQVGLKGDARRLFGDGWFDDGSGSSSTTHGSNMGTILVGFNTRTRKMVMRFGTAWTLIWIFLL